MRRISVNPKNNCSGPSGLQLKSLRHEFFEALITYLLSDFRNLKLQIQYGERKSSNSTNFRETIA